MTSGVGWVIERTPGRVLGAGLSRFDYVCDAYVRTDDPEGPQTKKVRFVERDGGRPNKSSQGPKRVTDETKSGKIV